MWLWDLGPPHYVHAVRLRYSLSPAGGRMVRLRLGWRNRTGSDLNDERSSDCLLVTDGAEHSVTLWVNDNIDEVAIQSDAKLDYLKITEVTALVP